MIHNRFSIGTTAIGIAMLACFTSAQAVTLNNAFTVEPFLDTALPGTTSAARPELAGVVLEDNIQPFSFHDTSGTVQSRVVREDGTGTLDFYWRINVDENSRNGVDAFRVGNFGYSYLTDADWRIDGLGSVAPHTARLFNPASHPDGSINFLFNDPAIGNGSGSYLFFLHTDAMSYNKAAQYDLLCAPSDCISTSYSTFAPAIPEPETYAMLLAGLGLLGFMARRRKETEV